MAEIKQTTISCEVVEDYELTSSERELLQLAREARGKAYSVYSGFHVGAALKLGNGKVFTGNNQENMSYPSGLCAERVALFCAMSQYPEQPVELIVLCADTQRFPLDEAVPPCGGCRQVMMEYEIKQQQPMRVLLSGNGGKHIRIAKVGDLLPFTFIAEGLKRG